MFDGYLDGIGHVWGLEWDKPDLGKHNGTFNNLCIWDGIPGHCGFIKNPNKHIITSNNGNSILQAINIKYNDNNILYKFDQLYLQGKELEFIGFEKWSGYLKENFEIIIQDLDLAGYSITNFKFGDVVTEQIDFFKNVRSLNLSHNLIYNWDDLLNFLQICNNLSKLNISHNRFLVAPSSLMVNHTVKSLNLSSMLLHYSKKSGPTLAAMLSSFPMIEKLDLSNNELDDNDISKIRWPVNLKTLILDDNNLKKFTLASSLESLYLSNNTQLSTISTGNEEFSLLHLSIQGTKLVQNMPALKLPLKLKSMRLLTIEELTTLSNENSTIEWEYSILYDDLLAISILKFDVGKIDGRVYSSQEKKDILNDYQYRRRKKQRDMNGNIIENNKEISITIQLPNGSVETLHTEPIPTTQLIGLISRKFKLIPGKFKIMAN